MEWKYSPFRPIQVKTTTIVKDLLTMTKAQQIKVVPADLCKKFQQGKKVMPEDVKAFTTCPSAPEPLVMKGKNKQTLALRLCIPESFLTTLKETKHLLSQHPEKSGSRSQYKSHNYCLWAKYADHPYMSADLLEDKESA